MLLFVSNIALDFVSMVCMLFWFLLLGCRSSSTNYLNFYPMPKKWNYSELYLLMARTKLWQALPILPYFSSHCIYPFKITREISMSYILYLFQMIHQTYQTLLWIVTSAPYPPYFTLTFQQNSSLRTTSPVHLLPSWMQHSQNESDRHWMPFGLRILGDQQEQWILRGQELLRHRFVLLLSCPAYPPPVLNQTTPFP